MAVNFNTASSANTAVKFKTADVFANFHVELADGTKIQFGGKGIGLYLDRATDAAHIKRLTEGGPEAHAALMKVLRVTLHTVGEQTPVSDIGY